MEHKILFFLTIASLSLTVQANKRFKCDPDDLSIYYIGNDIPLSCEEGKLCNNAAEVLRDICLPKENVCWFTCKKIINFTIDGDDLEFACPSGMICNEERKKSCDPCILEVCDDEPKWTCSETDERAFIMEYRVGRCYDDQVCKTENVPPCNNPCTSDDSPAPSPTTVSKPTQPNTPSSTVQTTTRPITTTKEPGTTTKEPITTTKEPITTTKEPITTTKEPITTTTTKEPGTTTKEPITTTKEPITTTEEPITTTKEPITTTTTKEPTEPNNSDPTDDPTTPPTTLSTHGDVTTITSTISKNPTEPETTTSAETTPTVPNTSMTTTSATTIPPFKIPNCNDGQGATNPCRDGPSPNIYYYKCNYYSPVWFDYEVKFCKNINSDPFCIGKVKCN